MKEVVYKQDFELSQKPNKTVASTFDSERIGMCFVCGLMLQSENADFFFKFKCKYATIRYGRYNSDSLYVEREKSVNMLCNCVTSSRCLYLYKKKINKNLSERKQNQ